MMKKPSDRNEMFVMAMHQDFGYCPNMVSKHNNVCNVHITWLYVTGSESYFIPSKRTSNDECKVHSRVKISNFKLVIVKYFITLLLAYVCNYYGH